MLPFLLDAHGDELTCRLPATPSSLGIVFAVMTSGKEKRPATSAGQIPMWSIWESMITKFWGI
ncbi:hypothetical protein VCSRO111_1975 [Vibrio cholerae]|nr:hypothetical protein [Vibrio cholerae]ORP13841.1 hypothetical protein B7947_06185 [Vibrio paracholerae]RBM57122.1 hypothetical protein DLR67_16845 [Vibrio paracholerae]RBM60937.1 hypothetical protein DLR71_13720 [Vibrio paracholerae]RBM87691.1 hypothetical protein DLR73_09650 [Vibrio paracholerae]